MSDADLTICICGHTAAHHSPHGRRACVYPTDQLKACPCLAFTFDHYLDDEGAPR